MGPGEAVAAVALAGVAIGVLVTIGHTLSRWIDFKRRKIELEAEAAGAARQGRRDDYVDLLEERVRVLERIATDKGVHLADEIENLRREPKAELPNEELN